MAININAKTTGVGGLETSADNSGNINIQSGGSTVMSVTSSGVAVTGSFSQNGAVYSTQPTFRNLIINGDMSIAQRGTSATGITSTGYQTVDRFTTVLTTAGTWTQTQDTDVPSGQGFSTSLKMACTTADASLAAGDQLNIQQRIEAQNLQHLKYGTSNAESLTMSFWVKSNKTGTYTFWIYQADDNRAISKTYTIDSADTWEKKTITIAGDTTGVIDNDNGAGLWVGFYLAAGSNFTSGTLNTSWNTNASADRVSSSNVNLADSTSNYINITGVQLEVGSTATDFEHLPYDIELARCQRYFCSSFNPGVTPANGIANSVITIMSAYSSDTGWSPWIPFPVPMRTAPSTTPYRDSALGTDGQWTYYNSGYIALTSTSLSPNGTTNGFYCNGSRTSAFTARNSYLLRGNFTADAEL